MLDSSEEINGLIHTVTEIAKSDKKNDLVELLLNSHITVRQTDYDNWNGGIYGYTIYVTVDVKTFIGIKDIVEEVEKELDERFSFAVRHLDDERIHRVSIIPKSNGILSNSPNPHRPFTASEIRRRQNLADYLDRISEDELIEEILLPLFRQLGFYRVTASGHKDKTQEYGKDVWMKYTLPTQHVLYFGIQAKRGKLDAAGMTKDKNTNIAEIYNQVLMMLGHEIFDSEIGKRVLVDHAFIVTGGEITKAAKGWLANILDASKRRQIIFMDREDILNLFVVTNLPLPSGALSQTPPSDDLPF